MSRGPKSWDLVRVRQTAVCSSFGDEKIDSSLSLWNARSLRVGASHFELCTSCIDRSPNCARKWVSLERSIFSTCEQKKKKKRAETRWLIDDNTHALRNNNLQSPDKYRNDLGKRVVKRADGLPWFSSNEQQRQTWVTIESVGPDSPYGPSCELWFNAFAVFLVKRASTFFLPLSAVHQQMFPVAAL